MRQTCVAFLVLLLLTAADSAKKRSYLFVWAGDADHKASDFLGVIDADPASPQYGAIVASVPTGDVGTHPHHTEDRVAKNGHLLANGFHTGDSYLFDLNQPMQPRLLTSFGEVGGYHHPHTYLRMPNGNIMATFQYTGEHKTGGIVEMDERGKVVRSGSAADPSIPDPLVFPYSLLPLPKFDRIVSTTTDMDQESPAESPWIQIWSLSDLKLRKSIKLPPGPRGDENKLTGEPRLLADGKSVYIHTFSCGLYLVRGLDTGAITTQFVKGFDGMNCGVPILTGTHWLATVPSAHALISLDIRDPEHPREVSRVTLNENEAPHWAAIDPSGRRVVVNSSGYVKGNRLYLINLDPATGKLTLDTSFKDRDGQPGIDMNGKSWPHGFTGNAAPHGTVFSR